MPLIKTHLDLRNKCIKIYILESIEYSGGLFNTFIEIKLTNLFIYSAVHSVPSAHKLPFPLKQNICQHEKTIQRSIHYKLPLNLHLGLSLLL